MVDTTPTPTSLKSSSRSRSKMSWSPQCSPVAVVGIGLIVAQLMIFNIGISFFHNESDSGNQSSDLSLQRGGQLLLQQKRQGLDAARARIAQAAAQTEGEQARVPKNRKIPPDPNADGTFNGYPVYFRENKQDIYSLAHCVGENYQEGKAWMHRSCRFSFLCFDTAEKEFVVFQNPDEPKLYDHLAARPFLDVSQSYMKRGANHSNTVSLGGINLKWTARENGYPRLEWFPRIVPADEVPASLSYYELPPQVVMVPFHSLNGANPGHMVWDDFLPIYTLLTMFQLEDDSALLMMRYVLKGGRGLWASCDWKEEKREGCEKMHKKFFPLMMGRDPNHNLTTNENFDFRPTSTTPKSHLVCAKNGLAGMGALTDHGTTKSHGWEDADYETTHNHGRGGMLYAFRNYMMANIGMPIEYQHKPPFRIVFSEKSSDIPSRVIDFTSQIDLLRKSFNSKFVSVESYVFKDLSLDEQVAIASQASIFITGCGGGAVTATFLPKGGSVFIYYLEDGGVKDNKETGTPARLDWDLFNNLAYLKVHWLPKRTMHTETDLRALSYLVQHEIDGLMRERHGYNFFF